VVDNDEISMASLKVLNQPLIVRNLGVVSKILNIHRIKVTSECSAVLRLIQDNFPAISVDEYATNNTRNNINDNTPTDTSTSARSKISIKGDLKSLEIPLNSALWYLQSEKKFSKSYCLSMGLSLYNSKNFARRIDRINISKCIII
jgi:hypothetical protein